MKRQGSVEASQDRSGDAGTRFRVRVSMKKYFSDERALAYMCVRSGRRVRWLQRRLRALFPLPPRFALLSAGHLLPPDEPLAVLHPDDLVDVVPSHVDLETHRVEGDDVDFVCRTVGVASAPEFGMSDPNRSNTVSDRVSPATDRESNEVHASVDETLTPSESAREHDDGDELSERKRRALMLLQQYCGTEECSEQRELRPRRRRVRRRRREPPPPSPLPASLPAPHLSHGHEVGVLRNGIQMPRTPRLIRPLADTVSS
ncbi:unnamed protein product [Arctia plantaginis]|uniref:Coilin n=1 Tax=Arctia plantaginis TaxID=874455 RepID=A0A8S0YPX8_ARCPL|nr:unnamed protein product [Arctia plantaginis]